MNIEITFFMNDETCWKCPSKKTTKSRNSVIEYVKLEIKNVDRDP